MKMLHEFRGGGVGVVGVRSHGGQEGSGWGFGREGKKRECGTSRRAKSKFKLAFWTGGLQGDGE